MGSLNLKRISAVISIVLAISMLLPGMVISESGEGNDIAVQESYLRVMLDSTDELNALEAIGTDIVSMRGWGAFVRVTDAQRDIISERYTVSDIPDRTIVDLMEQGITFDTDIGYSIPEIWTNPNTDKYLVTFVAPSEDSWYGGIEAVAGPVLKSVNEIGVVVELTEEEMTQVAELDYVEYIGPWEPAFKVQEILRSYVGPVQIEAYIFPGEDVNELNARLKSMDSWGNEDSGYGSVICWVDSTQIPDVAQLDSVSTVWNVPDMTTHNNKGSRNARAWELWDNQITSLPQAIRGEGQIVHIQDTGLDATHWDFTQGPLGNRIVYAQVSSDSDGHGTATAGNAVGNGYCMEEYLGLENELNNDYSELATSNPAGRNDLAGYAGRAPEAGLVSYQGLVTNEWDNGYGDGARIFSNSWGPSIISPGYSGSGDSFMDTGAYFGSLVLFSAGNDGPATTTTGGNSNGKLTVGVGASENFRPNLFFDSADDPRSMADFSSRGPVSGTDLRIKPDICETGTGGRTPASDDSDDYSNALNAAYSEVELIDADGDGRGDYTQSFGGTSMSCPNAAGDSALIRDYLQDVQGILPGNIHANLIKTLLIHGAEDMGYGYPSYAQGWGLANVRNSVAPLAPNVLQWFDNSAASNWAVTSVDVTDSAYPLKVTMVHWDATGSGTLTTDYNLIVTDPSGNTYEGNAFQESWSVPNPNWGLNTNWPTKTGGTSYDFDTDNVGGDDRNNVELVMIENPEVGIWTIEVDYDHGAAERVDVAVTCVTDQSLDANAEPIKVSMVPDTPWVLPERDDLGIASFQATPGGSVVVPYWIANGGTSNDNYLLSAPLLPTGFSVSYQPTSPIFLDSGMKAHGFARINVAGTVPQGTHVLQLAATSNTDSITQGSFKFNIDVVTEELPQVIDPVDSELHLGNPSVVSWGSSIGMAYLVYTEFGQHVWYTRSDDSGATWMAPVLVRESYHAGYLGLSRATGGTYDGDLMLVYTEYKPLGWSGSTSDTRGNELWIAYSGNNGNTWNNVRVFNNGEGPGAGNSYRTVSVAYASTDSSWNVVVEVFEYDGTNLNSANQVGISTFTKRSTNGGATWGAYVQLDDNVATQFYFFPHTEQDEQGGISLWYYHRDSGDGAQDRDAYYQYYSGSGPRGGWLLPQDAWDTGDNLMMPNGVSTTQGGGNRQYGAYIKGPHSDLDREMYVIFTDNEGGSFTTSLGPGAVIASDSHYGSRYLLDMDYTTDDQVWVNYMELVKYNPYGNQNVWAAADNDWTSGAGRTEFYATADSYHKSNQRTASIGNEVFTAYDTKNPTSVTDINIAHYSAGFAGVADNVGPTVDYPTTDQVYCTSGDIVIAAGNINDLKTGGSNIAGARYYTDMDATLIDMQTVDGAFDSMEDAAISTTTPIDTASPTIWPSGWHTIFIQGQDSSGNWGGFYETYIYTVMPPNAAPYLVNLMQPDGGEIWMGGSAQNIQWEMADDYTVDANLVIDLYYSTNSGVTYPNTIATGLTGFTSPAIYSWDPIPLIDSTQVRVLIRVTDQGALFTEDESLADFEIDSTAPAAATNFRAELVATHVMVYWDASVSPDVDRYEIYYIANNWDPTGDTYNFLADKGLLTSHQHSNVGIMNPSSYFYQLRTYDVAGHETRTLIQAAKTGSTQSLLASPDHWYMLGSFLVQSDTSLAHVIKGAGLPAGYDYIQVYDAFDAADPWKSFATFRPASANDLTDITNTQGFWMHLNANARFATAGYVDDMSISLKAGWNLVPYPFAVRQTSTANIDAHLAANCPNYDSMMIADYGAAYRLTTPTGAETLLHGSAIWVKVSADTTWTVVNY